MKILFLTAISLFACWGIANAQARFADCDGAIILCEKQNLVLTGLKGAGVEKSEIGFTSCVEYLKERNSVWLKWEVGQGGDLGFSIAPLAAGDDIDFVLYQLQNGLNDCSHRKEIRCMASGRNIGMDSEFSAACSGQTGLNFANPDVIESKGCSDDQDNYLSMLDVKAGESYLLYINNYSSKDGIRIEWSGAATFKRSDVLAQVNFQQASASKEIFVVPADDALMKSRQTANALYESLVASIGNKRIPNVFAGCSARDRSNTIPDATVDVGPLFPNPGYDEVSVRIHSDATWLTDVAIFDMVGRMVKNQPALIAKGENQFAFDISTLNDGIYFLHFRLNNTVYNRKFVKVDER